MGHKTCIGHNISDTKQAEDKIHIGHKTRMGHKIFIGLYNRPNLKVGYMNFSQGILRLVATGNVNVYRLDEKMEN
jgi:hypothetical protein